MKRVNKLGILIASLSMAAGVITFSSAQKNSNNENDGIDDIVDTFVPEYKNIKLSKFVTPSDDKYSTQKNYSMNILGDIETVWDTYTGSGTKIAIIDDGFDPNHAEYKRQDGTSAILSNSAYFESSGSYYVTVTKTLYSADSTCLDQEWDSTNSKWATHGTNTSTTCAAPMGNSGIVGIAPEADLLLIKTDMLLTSIEKAIRYAADQGCDVINMSLGAYAESFTDGYGKVYTTGTPNPGETQVYASTATALESACVYAHGKGSIIVAAAGNEATSVHSYPACNSYVIGVGALGQNLAGKLAKFSNHNKSETESGNKNVDILAPGYVYAAGKGGTKTSPTHTYNNTQGTSFSSPIIAGAAALWKQKYPSGTPDQFEERLLSTAAGIGTYKDLTIAPMSKDIDVNISGGRLDIGALMGLGSDVSGITISETSKNLYTSGSYSSNTSFEISANVTPNSALNQNIIWSTTNSNVAKLSKTTTVSDEIVTVTSGTTAGTATIKAKSEDGGFEASCIVSTTKYVPVTGFSLKDSNGNKSGTIKKGETVQLIPTFSPSNASYKEVIYIPEDESIVRVDDDTGIVTGLKVGSTDIYALCGNEELEDVYSITVEEAESGGTIFIDCYDKDTANDSSSTTCWSKDLFKDRVFLNNVANNLILTEVIQDKAYKRKGGISLGSSSKKGDITFTFDSTYKIDKVTLIGTYWDSNNSSTITLADKSGSGSLNPVGTEPSKCDKSIVFENLGGISSFKVYSPNRAVVYSLDCELVGGGGNTPATQNYTVSFNSNGGTGQMANTTTNGSSYIAPSCEFTKSGYSFDKWALDSTTGTKYSAGETILNISKDITLYATWKENQTSGGDDEEDIAYWTNWISDNQSALSTGGATLVSALRTKIANVAAGSSNKLTYDNLWGAYAKTDGIPGSNGQKIYDMYGGCEFTFGTDQDKGSHSKVGDTYNREHAVPKSWFGEKAPAISDIIHVVPTDSVVNGTRSNWAFGEVANASKTYTFEARQYNGVQYQKAGVSKFGTPKSIDGVSIKSGQTYVFEPDDQYKGDFARIYMYFAVRYGGTVCSAISDSGAAMFTSSCTESNPYVTNYGLALLKKWHELDPVSEKERTRNDAVEEVQGNRNPFVDYPQWADKIFGTNTTGGDTPTPTPKVNSISLDQSSLNLDLNGNKTATLTATVDADEGADSTVTWNSSNPSVATVSDGTVTALTTGSTTITAKAGEKEATCSVTVNDSTVTVTSVSLDKTELTLNVGEDATLKATINGTNIPQDAKVSWSSDELSIATVDANGKVTGIADGSAVITATYGEKFATCNVTIKGQSTPPVTNTGYTLVTDGSTLVAGDKILIVGIKSGSYYTIAPYESGNNCKQIAVSAPVNNSIETDAAFITLGGTSGDWTLFDGTYYLYAAGGTGSNYLKGTSSSPSNTGKWTISCDSDGKATIKCKDTGTTKNTIMYNSGSSLFSCYSSGQSEVYIYRLSGGSTPTPDKEIVNIELECNVSAVSFGEGKGSYEAPAELIATYNDATTGSIVPDEKDYSIDTYVLGNQTIYASYNGTRYEKTIKVTNKDASVGSSLPVTITGENFKKSMPDGWLQNGAGSDYADSNKPYLLKLDTTGDYFEYSKSDFSTNAKSITAKVSLKMIGGNSNSSFTVYALVKDDSGNLTTSSTIKGTISISGAQNAVKTNLSCNLTNPNEETIYGFRYVFTKGSNIGVSGATIEIAGAAANATISQQAISWADYFIRETRTLDTCLAETDNAKLAGLKNKWATLADEYEWMVSGAKDEFCASTDATIVEAREHYKYIVSKFGASNLGTDGAFVTDGKGQALSTKANNKIALFNMSNQTSLIVVVSLISVTSLGLYFYIKKRKEVE